MHLKMSSAKWRLFGLGLNELNAMRVNVQSADQDTKHGGPQGTMAWWRHQMEAFSALLAICAGIHRSPVNSSHKGQWRGALVFSLICFWINGWVNNRDAGELRRYRVHYDVTVMGCPSSLRYINGVTSQCQIWHFCMETLTFIFKWRNRCTLLNISDHVRCSFPRGCFYIKCISKLLWINSMEILQCLSMIDDCIKSNLRKYQIWNKHLIFIQHYNIFQWTI